MQAAALLANPENYNAESRQRLFEIRGKVDRNLRFLQNALQPAPGSSIPAAAYAFSQSISSSLNASRRRVDAGPAHNEQAMTASEWISTISRNIDDISKISHLVRTPLDDQGHATRFGITLKDRFFVISDSLGMDRALIGVVLAENRPFLPEEYLQLSNNHYIAQIALKKIDELLINFPRSSEMTQAQRELRHAYKEDYQTLRNAIIHSSQDGQPYPVNSTQWFDSATKGISAVLNVSNVIDLYIEEGITQIKAHHKQGVIMLLIILTLVLAVFSLAFRIVQRRILRPLNQLALSAKRIAADDFSWALTIRGNDEFSRVTEAFESMRKFLIDDRQRRSQKSRHELEKLSIAIDQSVNSVIMTDLNGTIEYVNPHFYRVTGYQPGEVIGRKMNILKSGSTPRETYDEIWSAIGEGRMWQGVLLNKKKTGEY